jgi:tRNA threonylcarbamoyladenosine biosynthesis protein TsaE
MKTQSTQQTQKQGEALAKRVILGQAPRIIALQGDLGGGKTTFTQGLAKGLGVKDKVLSPTFPIIRKYSGKRELIHIDCYRIESKDLLSLGWKEMLESKAVIVIEWAEKIKEILPVETLWIHFRFLNEKERALEEQQ